MKLVSFVFLSLAYFSPLFGAITLTPSTHGRVTFEGEKSSPSSTTSTTTANSNMPVGDTMGGVLVHAALFNFDVNTSAADIATASQILFKITPTGSGGIGADLRLIAITSDTNTVTGARSTASGTVVTTIPFSSLVLSPNPQTLVFDVTSYVKADALAGNYTSFRIESQHQQASGDLVGDFVQFGRIDATDARLEVIPEPGPAVLLGAAGMLAILRKRRHE